MNPAALRATPGRRFGSGGKQNPDENPQSASQQREKKMQQVVWTIDSSQKQRRLAALVTVPAPILLMARHSFSLFPLLLPVQYSQINPGY